MSDKKIEEAMERDMKRFLLIAFVVLFLSLSIARLIYNKPLCYAWSKHPETECTTAGLVLNG